MMDDDDALDRMLAALPLEEPPAALHARVMRATVYAPVRAGAAIRPWELWLVGLPAALAVWLAWLVLSDPRVAAGAVNAVAAALRSGGLTSPATLPWLAVGASAAWWASLISVPRRRTVEVR